MDKPEVDMQPEARIREAMFTSDVTDWDGRKVRRKHRVSSTDQSLGHDVERSPVAEAEVVMERSIEDLGEELSGTKLEKYFETEMLVQLVKKRQDEVNSKLGSRLKEVLSERASKRTEKLKQTSYYKALQRQKIQLQKKKKKDEDRAKRDVERSEALRKRLEEASKAEPTEAGWEDLVRVGVNLPPVGEVEGEQEGEQESPKHDEAPQIPIGDGGTGAFMSTKSFPKMGNRLRGASQDLTDEDESRPTSGRRMRSQSMLEIGEDRLFEKPAKKSVKTEGESNLHVDKEAMDAKNAKNARRNRKISTHQRLSEDCHDDDAINQAIAKGKKSKTDSFNSDIMERRREKYDALGNLSETMKIITETARTEFRTMDSNGDMVITFQEFIEKHPEESRVTFNEIDTDQDNVMSFSEYLAWRMREELAELFHALTVFSAVDEDMNGIVDVNEFSILLHEHPAHDVIIQHAKKQPLLMFEEFMALEVEWEDGIMTVGECLNECAKGTLRDVLRQDEDIPVSQFWTIMRLCYPDVGPNSDLVKNIDGDRDGYISFEEFWEAMVSIASRRQGL